MLSHIELTIEERAVAVVPLPVFADLTRRLLRDEVSLPYSPALCLAKDIKRQFGNAGFVHWLRMMRKFEPPWTNVDRKWLKHRRADWEDLDPYDLKGWCDHTIVDALAVARAAGVGHPSAQDILDELAARSGAKRATIQAELDRKEAAERAEIDAELEAEFAVYEQWLAAGEPANDPLADEHRTRKRRIRQHHIQAEYDALSKWEDEQHAANAVDDGVASDDPIYLSHIARHEEIGDKYEAKLAEWQARHGGMDNIKRIFLADKKWPPGVRLADLRKLELSVESSSASGVQPMPVLPLRAVPTEPLPDLIQSSGDFVRGFVPPDYLLDGVLQKQFCYSITAQTGVGKTTVAMLIAGHVACGRRQGNLDVEKGTVLYFAGENPTDVQMRWLGLTHAMRLDPETTDVHFVPGATPLSGIASRITTEVTAKGLKLALVVVDTAAAYFEGDDENSNTQAVEHARRMRSLTTLPGGPTVLILCHPTKRAAADDLIPRGGGAFLNEVDGNIALRKQDTVIGAEVQGKFRGREFSPIHFELNTVYHPILKDARGRDIPTVVARVIDENAKQRMADANQSHENRLLQLIFDQPGASLRTLATAMGWVDPKGQPQAMRVSRACEALAKDKLVQKHRNAWHCTSAGEKELNRMEAAVTSAVTVKPPLPPLPR